VPSRLRYAISDGREKTGPYPVQRAAFVVVFLVAVHSMLEYPLWYAYFLLPAVFAFGLCLERVDPRDRTLAAERGAATRPLVLASMLLVLAASFALYDYLRVVIIFAPPADAAPLDKRIADGRRSVLFAHHADYAAATVPEHPGQAMTAFRRAPHFLLDARLMLAWAKALEENGETEKARYVAARLREFRNDQADEFFAPCARSTSRPGTTRAPPRRAAAAVAVSGYGRSTSVWPAWSSTTTSSRSEVALITRSTSARSGGHAPRRENWRACGRSATKATAVPPSPRTAGR